MFLEVNVPSNYIPVAMQAVLAVTFVGFTLFAAQIIGPKRHSKNKDENFECGIESVGNARIPVSIKYLMTAILFVLFDVEVIFFYPYALNFKEMGVQGFLAVLLFVSFFLFGFFYVWKKGALEWEK